MALQIALLRGINVGPRSRVSMPELRELLTSLGYGDVRTLLQSGNLVLDSDVRAQALPGHVPGGGARPRPARNWNTVTKLLELADA